MTQYKTLNVKLSNSQLNKLKSGIKNGTEITSNLSTNVIVFFFFFFCLGFLSRPFTNHRTAGEGGGYFFNSSLPLPPALQTLRH